MKKLIEELKNQGKPSVEILQELARWKSRPREEKLFTKIEVYRESIIELLQQKKTDKEIENKLADFGANIIPSVLKRYLRTLRKYRCE